MKLAELERIRRAESIITEYEYELFLISRHNLFSNGEKTPEQREYIELIFREMIGLYSLKRKFLQELNMLTVNERNIIKYYYYDGVGTWDKVARALHYSKEHVYTLRRNALHKLQCFENDKKKEWE